MKILFLTTGGTIDKDYPSGTGARGFEIGEAAVLRVIERFNRSFSYSILQVARKDSQDINESDRKGLLRACSPIAGEYGAIVITHGTDTMLETAEYLARGLTPTIPIILTGAFRPERFADSDAPVNVGLALGAASVAPPGVYVAMNGRVYQWNKFFRTAEGNFVESQW